MASLTRSKNGSYLLQFAIDANERRGFRLGRISEKTAQQIKQHVELIVIAKQSGQALDSATARWLTKIGDKLVKQLVKVGLIPEPSKANDRARLNEFLQDYISGRKDLKPRTIINFNQARIRLVTFFTPDKAIQSITQADADRWLIGLKSDGYATATIAKLVKVARQFFAAAKRGRLIGENPFEHLKGGSMVNSEKLRFIDMPTAEKILAACPDGQWRLIVALCRYGGLRCPSELLGLRWGDVLWDRNRFIVHVPKLEHHAGKEVRFVPIFPELRPHLEAAFDGAMEDHDFDTDKLASVYVVGKSRDDGVNLRTHLKRIIIRAGVKPWPRLFQNLRASRETELAREYPLHVVCQWIGNSKLIAAQHYLQTTDEDFERAAGKSVADLSRLGVSVADLSRLEPSENTENASVPKAHENKGENVSGHVIPCHTMSVKGTGRLPPAGLEPPPDSLEETADAAKSDAKTYATPDLAGFLATLTPEALAALRNMLNGGGSPGSGISNAGRSAGETG